MVDLGPFHILSYGTLLGVEIFQSFIGGIVSFRVLSRPQFAVLQSHLFPIYFSMQTALPVVVAFTLPGDKSLAGPASLAGVLTPENRLTTLLPLATVFLTGLTNLVFLGPQTVKIMAERKKQEAIDGKKSYDPPPHSKEMLALNKKFGKLHGYSTLVNLAAVIATVYYGAVLGKRIY